MISKQPSPNYALAQSVAYETVYFSNQNKLPLSIKKLIRSIPNLHIQKYSKFAEKRNLSLEETYEILDSEEGCLWMRSDGQYIILYNDAVDNSGRIRFTLAHELGHYLLKHNEKSKKTSLTRYSLTSEDYDVFEKEANYFAKRLLAPIPLIDLYIASWSKIYPQSIEFAFDTSFTVASYIINDLHRRQKLANIVKEGHPLTKNFVDYIDQDSTSQICKECRSLQSITHRYCSFCSSSDFVKSTAKNYDHYFLERKEIMIYSKIETNEHGSPITCPRCEAENLDDNFQYCPYCSIFFHNVCLGKEEDQFIETINGEVELTIGERSVRNGCSNDYLDGGFRYCPDCGSESSFYAQKLLHSWEDETLNRDPFAKNIY